MCGAVTVYNRGRQLVVCRGLETGVPLALPVLR